MNCGMPELWNYTLFIFYNIHVEFLMFQLLLLPLLKNDLKAKQMAEK